MGWDGGGVQTMANMNNTTSTAQSNQSNQTTKMHDMHMLKLCLIVGRLCFVTQDAGRY